MQSGNVAAPGDALFHRRNGGGLPENRKRAESQDEGKKRACFCFCMQRRVAACDSLFRSGEILASLLKAAERTDLVADGRFKTRDTRRQNFEALERTLMPTFRTKTRDEWLKRLEANDVPVAPLYNIAEAMADPQVRHLGLTEELEHAKAGKLTFIGGPVKYD